MSRLNLVEKLGRSPTKRERMSVAYMCLIKRVMRDPELSEEQAAGIRAALDRNAEYNPYHKVETTS